MAEPPPFPGPTNAPGLPADLPAQEAPAAARARYEKVLEAWLEAWKQSTQYTTQYATQRTAAQTAREDAERAAETALLKATHDAYVATTQSSLDRALTRMNVVTASAGTITTVYTGLLALVYAAEPGKGEPLSAVALVPALFLGLSLLLVTVYAAMFRRTTGRLTLLPTGIGGQVAEERLTTFLTWCFGGIWARAWALHAGIVSLGVGLVTLPLPFVDVPEWLEWLAVAAGIVAVAGTAVVSAGLLRRLRR